MGNRDARGKLVGFRERALRWAWSTAHARGRARRARRARVGARGADLGAGSGQVEGACAAHVGVQAGRVRVRARQQGRGEREQQAHLCHHLRTFFFLRLAAASGRAGGTASVDCPTRGCASAGRPPPPSSPTAASTSFPPFKRWAMLAASLFGRRADVLPKPLADDDKFETCYGKVRSFSIARGRPH
jgi:hypothetical protein